MSLHGVGIDIADASRISRLLESAGDRFTGRWFTPEEIAQCDASADRAAAYALRFAAKEAVWKAVGGGVQGVPWRSIAILHDEDTQLLRVSLTGELGEVAERTGLGIDDVIAIHTAPVYTVYAIGSHPGYCYLGGLDARLFLPRRDVPLLSIPKGSLSVAGMQTGVAASAGPSGWHTIGMVDTEFFDPARTPPSLLQPGDTIRFRAERVIR